MVQPSYDMSVDSAVVSNRPSLHLVPTLCSTTHVYSFKYCIDLLCQAQQHELDEHGAAAV